MKLADKIREWWKRYRCKHPRTRPALAWGQPAEMCEDCEKVRTMTEAEFYAKWGEKYMGMLKGAQGERSGAR